MSAVTHHPIEDPAQERRHTRRDWQALLLWLLVCLLLPLLLAACGGGGGGGGGNAHEAPASSSAVIGPAGGTLTGPDGVQVIVPAGALRANTTLTITRSGAGAPPRDGFLPAPAAIYEFTPHGIAFEIPVTIRLPVPAGTLGPAAWFASTDASWQESEITVAGGFASVQRNTFSWGMVIAACSIPAGAPPNPDRCFSPRGHTSVAANPANALTLTGYSNAYNSSGGSFRLDAAATLTLTAVYNLWPSCGNARLTLYRRQLDRSPDVLETLYDQPVLLHTGAHGGNGAGGTTVLPPIALNHLDNGRHMLASYVSCQRIDGFQARYYDASVINVAVPVPASTQTIGGTVAGLNGTVVLRNNGADDLTLSADAAFLFPTPVATGATYNVTVASQPANQTCTVSNGSGTANTDINNVAVSCSTTTAMAWQGALQLSASMPASAASPQVAFDGLGNAFATWRQLDGAVDGIWASRYTPAGGWSTPVVIDHSANPTLDAKVAADAAGNALVIWDEVVGANQQRLRASRYTPGGGWAALASPEPDPVNAYAIAADLAIDSAGVATVVWLREDNGQRRIRANRLVGGSWQTAVNVDDGAGDVGAPRVAALGAGGALAIWEQSQFGYFHVYGNRFNGTGWSTADRLHENNSPSLFNLNLVSDGSGGAIALWNQGIDSAPPLVHTLRYAGGTWQAVETVSEPGENSANAHVAMNANGQAMAVWREERNGAWQLWATPRAPTGSWHAAPGALRIDGPLGDGGGSSPLAVAVDPAGHAVVVFSHAPPGASSDALYAVRFNAASASWGTPQAILGVPPGATSFVNSVALAMDANGRAIAVWDQDKAGNINADIWANVLR